MWRSSSESAQMDGRVRGSEKGRRWDNDDDDEVATDNVDSGFLSAGNMQVSAEIRDPGTPQPQEEDDRRMTVVNPSEDRQRAAEPASAASGATISAPPPPSPSLSSSSATLVGTEVAEVPARVIDSGVVDVDLSENLNQLTLGKRPGSCLNPLVGNEDHRLTQVEPTTMILELAPVKAAPAESAHIMPQYRDDDLLLEQHQLDGARKKRAIMSENTWQLYYAQDDDGDTTFYPKDVPWTFHGCPEEICAIWVTSQFYIADASIKIFPLRKKLHIAVMQGFLETALELIRLVPHPSLLNIYNDKRQAPLHLAVLTSQSLIVRRLILAGADPSLRNSCGNTALHLACRSGDLACAKALTDPLSPMERNKLMPGQTVPALPQDLEQRNYNGEMCLHLSAAKGHVNLVRLLLRLGADLEAREGLAGYTALHLAMEHRCRSVVNFLLQECKPCLDTQTYSGLTAYQIALSIDIQLARELVRYGAKPEPLPNSDSESSSEDETYGETSYLPVIVKMQNAVEVKV